MKALICKTLLLSSIMAIAMTSTIARAQRTLKIPFSFQIGDALYPAGSYSVKRQPYGHFVVLEDCDNRELFHWAIGPGDPAPTDARIVLKFDESLQVHLLRSVQYGSLITGRLDEKALASKRDATISGQ